MRMFSLAFACAVSGLQTAPRRCYKARRRHATPDDDDNAKWSVDVDEFAERIESAKAAVVGGLADSLRTLGDDAVARYDGPADGGGSGVPPARAVEGRRHWR